MWCELVCYSFCIYLIFISPVPCPDGYVPAPCTEHCYLFVDEKMTWEAARTHCPSTHSEAYLCEIESKGESDYVNSIMKSNCEIIVVAYWYLLLIPHFWNETLHFTDKSITFPISLYLWTTLTLEWTVVDDLVFNMIYSWEVLNILKLRRNGMVKAMLLTGRWDKII